MAEVQRDAQGGERLEAQTQEQAERISLDQSLGVRLLVGLRTLWLAVTCSQQKARAR